MKYLLTLSLILLMTTCGIFKNNKSMHEGYGEGIGNSHKDTIKVVLTSGDSMGIENNSLEVGSGGEWHSPKPKSVKENLKIIRIQNTKVINRSSDMSEGRVVYKVPSEMKIRSTYQVLLRISKSKATLSIYDSLQGEVRTSEIPVTQTMNVNLIDPSPKDDKAFDIIADNNGVQVVDSGDTYTEWTWNVTPIKVGNKKLKLVVSIVRGGIPKDIVYEDVVDVSIDLPTQIVFFWNKWWHWIIGTFLLPFFIFLYKKRKEKNDETAKKKTGNGDGS